MQCAVGIESGNEGGCESVGEKGIFWCGLKVNFVRCNNQRRLSAKRIR